MQTPALQSLLILTDDHELAAHWVSLAEQSNCAVARCSELFAAQSALARILPETVVVDLDTTGEQGWTLIKSLRGAESDIDFPWIIGLQSNVGEDEVDAAMGAGINDIIPKDGGLDAFKKALSEADCVHHERKLHSVA